MKKYQPIHSLFALILTLVSVTAAFGGGVVFIGYTLSQHHRPIAVEIFPNAVLSSRVVLQAKSAILYDPLSGRILYAKNPAEKLPLASLAKLMTANVALDAVPPSTLIRITKDDLGPEGDWGFRVGDSIPLSELIRFGLVASSNDAIAAVAGSVGKDYVTRMNHAALNMGLSQTSFYNATGLDLNAHTAGAYGSAYDVARLAARFYKKYPSYFEATATSKVSIADTGRTLSAQATAAPLLSVPGFIGAKTGYTDLAGGNLVTIFDIEVGRPLVVVVLGSTQDGRFSDTKTLIDGVRAANNGK